VRRGLRRGARRGVKGRVEVDFKAGEGEIGVK